MTGGQDTSSRIGILIPILEGALPRLRRRTLHAKVAASTLDRTGAATDWYVVALLVVATLWYALVSSSSGVLASTPFRVAALLLLVGRGYELLLSVTSWVFVDTGMPNPRRAILLFCINIAEIRVLAHLAAVLAGVIPASKRWGVLFGVGEASLPPAIAIPYQLLTWVIVALAVGALAGSIRSNASPAT